MSIVALLLCAGRGERLGADLPKAFVPLAGRPLFTWSLGVLQACEGVDEIVVVGPVRTARELMLASGQAFDKIADFVEGGSERQDSVVRGLAVVSPAHELVAVHDAARALVGAAVVERTIAQARAGGAAIAAVPLADTLKRVEAGRIRATAPRAGMWCAQTPQVFRRDWLAAAHAAAAPGATDDAALVEALGHEVWIAAGDALNFKITTAADLALAEAWLVRAAAREAGER
jgi:2-C-methyl-D-erythritol 4-phosphate cytidylyltransferase